MGNNVQESFDRLRAYCEAENYKGWDPYDGLNSKLAHALLPLKHSAIMRLCIIQGFKRCPVNLRKLALVPKEYNAKGIGLFLQGYVNLLKLVRSSNGLNGLKGFGTEEELEAKVREIANLLISLRSDTLLNSSNHLNSSEPSPYHGACWGYNFDWQARRLFLFPAYTPTVVATNFCATALLEAYEVLKEGSSFDYATSTSLSTSQEPNGSKSLSGSKGYDDIEKYKEIALSAAEFVVQDLHRYYPEEGNKDKFLFSYSKLPGNDTVFNASLLGSRLLANCYKYTGKEVYLKAARASVKACVEGQAEDGSWVYGLLPVQSWIDSFHTGYNLDGLIAYYENCILGKEDNLSNSSNNSNSSNSEERMVREAIEKGLKFYLENHFEKDGTPKYYHNKMYPIDIHCPGQLFVTLARLHKFGENRELAEKVMQWVIKNMQDKKGYFYYQLKPGMSSKISYMRWSNAFMFCAMTYYLLEQEGLSVSNSLNGLNSSESSK